MRHYDIHQQSRFYAPEFYNIDDLMYKDSHGEFLTLKEKQRVKKEKELLRKKKNK